MKKVCINFKMNFTLNEYHAYFEKLTFYLDSKLFDCLYFYVHPFYWMNLANKFPMLNIGVQGGIAIDSGNMTTKISLYQLASENVKQVLLGHCEDLKYNHLNLCDVHSQLSKALSLSINPLVCFGEPNEIKDYHERFDYLKNLLNEIIDNQNLNQSLTLAYEPIYAIGQNIEINVELINKLIGDLKQYIINKYHLTLNILYGGSVNATNFDQFMLSENLDGVLIGSYAWKIENLLKVMK